MKLRPSLYVNALIALLLLGGVMVVVFTVVTAHYFEAGLDISMGHTMRRVAWETELDAQGVGSNLGFVVTRDWDHQTQNIRKLFADPPVTGRMVKNVEGIPIFGPPKRLAFAGRFKNEDGEVRYVAGEFSPSQEILERETNRPSPFARLMIIAGGNLVVFGAILILLLRTLARPVERLGQWAAGLNEQTLGEPLPDFRYSELNTLAGLIRNSLDRAREGLEREHRFLRFASHELRTPIAVIRSNASLLRRLAGQSVNQTRMPAVVERIERAVRNMGDLTETLLWLSREEPESIAPSRVDLSVMVNDLAHDLHYLLADKPVSVQVQTTPAQVEVPEVVLRMVLGNLIRNAFQHAQSGEIHIEQDAQRVRVVNTVGVAEILDAESLGFGLGLELARRLSARYGWACLTNEDGDAYVAELRLKHRFS